MDSDCDANAASQSAYVRYVLNSYCEEKVYTGVSI